MNEELMQTVERLAATASLLEQAAARIEERHSIDHIVATVESRESELEAKLAAAEQKIAELQASAAAGRKTLPAAAQSLLAKQGVTVESIEAGVLDAALVSLSMEQRFAVKAQLLRAGLLS